MSLERPYRAVVPFDMHMEKSMTISIHGGTITTSSNTHARNFRAVFGNNAEDFYSYGAASWWLEMQESVRLSRLQRNAR